MRINEDYYDNIERSDIETNVSDTLDYELRLEMMMKCIEDVCDAKRPESDVTGFPDAVYKVTDWDELDRLILNTMEIYGNDCNLNWIDVSEMTEMDELFSGRKFKGDISRWDVSKVKNMCMMFYDSEFNGDISGWDIRRVTDFEDMFTSSKFKRSLAGWLHKNPNFSYKTAGLW